jgi:predicted patatin/cPLA2 family phospholipase
MTIKHLVLSGGSIGGCAFMGAVRYLVEHSFLDMDQLETIYATSVGTYMAVVITLGYDWDTLFTYMVKRNWGQTYKINIEAIVNALHTGGVFDKQIIVNTFKSLFNGKDLDLDMTLLDFYQYNKKEIHFVCSNITDYKAEDFSYLTHPDVKLLDVVYASSGLPLLFPPMQINGKLYFDGAAFLNYPINLCLDRGFDRKEILGICKMPNTIDMSNEFMEEDKPFKLVYYLMYLFKRVWTHAKYTHTDDEALPYEVAIPFNTGIIEIKQFVESEEARQQLIHLGEEYAKQALDSWIEKDDETASCGSRTMSMSSS